MIRLTDISKTYRGGDAETQALHNLSLNIADGEFAAVMGPSGCGKSTLLNILGLLDVADSGQYLLDGRDVSRLPEREMTTLRRDMIGFVFQNFQLVDDLSAADNIALLLAYRDIPRRQQKEMVDQALEIVGLSHRRNARPADLSGGQQQRIAVARAIVGNPRIILADEPTGNLDSRNGDEIMDMLEGLNRKGSTILMVTHSPSHAARAQRIINMLDGRVVTPEEQEL